MTRAEDVTETPAGEDRRHYHPVQKDWATFLETSEETGGEHTIIEVELAPGGGNSPHYHKTYDEHLEVLEGALKVLVDKETRALRPGQKAVAPTNTLHNFRNPTKEPTMFLVELRPGSAGFEKALKAGYGLARATLVSAPTGPRRTSTIWRCSWNGPRYGCPASSPSPGRCSGSWRRGHGGRGSTGSWRRDTVDRGSSG
jgi:quercetin dioxygenase-like cupin family protein